MESNTFGSGIIAVTWLIFSGLIMHCSPFHDAIETIALSHAVVTIFFFFFFLSVSFQFAVYNNNSNNNVFPLYDAT